MPYEINTMIVNGEPRTYVRAVNDADGTNGLLGANPDVRVGYNKVTVGLTPPWSDGENVPYWWADAIGENGTRIPTDFVANYLAYYTDDFTLVTGSNVSQWDDRSANANHLTQGTSSNQPVLTQGADQFNNKVDFDTDDYMEGLPTQSGDFTYVFKGVEIADNLEQRLLSDGVSSNFRLNSFSNLIQINAGGIYRDLGTFTGTSFNTVILKREGTTISAYVDGVLAGTPQTNSGNFVGNRLMHGGFGLDGSLQELYVYDRALTDDEIKSFEPIPINNFAPNVATLDGSSQYFDAGDASAFDIFSGLNPYSIEYWYNPDTTSGASATISKVYLNQREFNVGRNGTSIYFNRTDSSGFDTLTGSASVTAGTWYHIVATFDGTNMNLYINAGTPDTITSSKNITATTTTVKIGGNTNASGSGIIDGDNCAISSPRFYNRALNASEVATLYNDGKIFCYADIDTSITDDCVYAPNLMTFNGRTEASALVDNSSSGITTTAIGAPTYEPTGALIVSDGDVQYNASYATLDGSTKYYDAGNPTELQITGNITASIWGYVPDNIANGGTMINKTNTLTPTQGEGWRLGYQRVTGLGSVLVSSTGNYADPYVEPVTPSAIPVDTWFHLAFTYDGSQVTLYLNGVAGTPVAYSSGIKDHGTVRIGNFNINSSYLFGGSLASPMVFNRALNASEITELYNDGVVPAYADIATSITDDCVYAPRLSNWGTNTGNELTDQSTSGITTTAFGSPTYESELAVECDEDPV